MDVDRLGVYLAAIWTSSIVWCGILGEMGKGDRQSMCNKYMEFVAEPHKQDGETREVLPPGFAVLKAGPPSLPFFIVTLPVVELPPSHSLFWLKMQSRERRECGRYRKKRLRCPDQDQNTAERHPWAEKWRAFCLPSIKTLSACRRGKLHTSKSQIWSGNLGHKLVFGNTVTILIFCSGYHLLPWLLGMLEFTGRIGRALAWKMR